MAMACSYMEGQVTLALGENNDHREGFSLCMSLNMAGSQFPWLSQGEGDLYSLGEDSSRFQLTPYDIFSLSCGIFHFSLLQYIYIFKNLPLFLSPHPHFWQLIKAWVYYSAMCLMTPCPHTPESDCLSSNFMRLSKAE